MNHIFISHASSDDAFVKELRRALEAHKLAVWVDSRNLRGGVKLNSEIEQAIYDACKVIAVLSLQTVNSPWVRKEIAMALDVERQKKDDGYLVIPLLLPGMTPDALGNWFEEEPLAIPVEADPGKLAEALPAILAALGERLPTDPVGAGSPRPGSPRPAPPVDELILELRDPAMIEDDGKRRARAIATLVYHPASAQRKEITSRRFTFTAPLGPIELDKIRWYLEEYYLWPVDLFEKRAKETENKLPEWGKGLYNAALGGEAARDALAAWTAPGGAAARRFSVWVESELPEGAAEAAQAEAHEAASALLSLPWELLHDRGGYLVHGKRAAHVRRQMPNREAQERRLASTPIRILLLSPRPEVDEAGKQTVGYIDHRANALPLVAAAEELGELADLTVLTPPTLGALEKELGRAAEAGQPYDVVHFDGHGVYDRQKGLGALLFEHLDDADKPVKRRMQLVYADELAAIIRGHGIPLVFLDACQTGQVEADPKASVAAKLLEQGVSSVVAMSHSVLVEASWRFVRAFYVALALGKRVGEAMLAGQKALKEDTNRGQIMGAGTLRLQDWFLPVLYQEPADPQLFATLPSGTAQELTKKQRKLALGKLPETPPHTFVGRSYELLMLERLLPNEPYLVVRGTGGAGKTTIAVELARWLVRSGRCERAAFISLEEIHDARGALDALGRQLLPEGDKYSVAQFGSLDEARQPVERALNDDATMIVVDNVESVLPAFGDPGPQTPEVLALCRRLLDADGRTRLVFTSRAPLPAPFDRAPATLELGALREDDAIRLVERVLANKGWRPPAQDSGETPEEVMALVRAAQCHARALVLLAPAVARQGVRAVTTDLYRMLHELEREHPGDRENSLYASVELSLRWLPSEMRERVTAVAVCHGGGQLYILGEVMGVDREQAGQIALALIDVGLGEDLGDGYLRLDPALPPYLAQGQTPEQLAALRARWAEALQALVGFLYEQRFKDTHLAARLTRLELPNLVALLDWLPGHATPEQIVDVAGSIEQLLANLGQPVALARAVAAREAAGRALGEWSHARFEGERLRIERLLAAGDFGAAVDAAKGLVERSRAAGEAAYKDAAYDIALAHYMWGEALEVSGLAGQALAPLAEAQRRFEILAAQGSTSAARMASACITLRGDCLVDLGRLDAAAEAYEEAIRRDKERDDVRDVGVGVFQLGTVRLLQKRYAEALTAYQEKLAIDERLGEPGSIAATWHQIGRVHRGTGQFEAAERAYRQSLAIEVQRGSRAGEAASLIELGNLYDDMGRLEEAVTFSRQAADIHVALKDQANEGRARNNMAGILVKLGRYKDARKEIVRAIECKEPFGHAALPWTTWNIKRQIEEALGDEVAAREAWGRARDSYLAYRRDGGYAQGSAGQLCDLIWQSLQAGDLTSPEQAIAEARQAGAPPPFLAALEAILGGSRDPALADDPALYYGDAAELALLVERLAEG